MRKRRLRHVEGALQIDVDNGAEAVRRKVFGKADEVAGCAVDENVEASERRQRRRHDVAHGRRIAHVGGLCDGTYAERAQFDCRRLEMFHRPAGDCDIAAVRRKRKRNAPADPGTAAGDERHTPFEQIGLKDHSSKF